MVLLLYVKIVDTEKSRISEYRIYVYAGHLSSLGKWSFYYLGQIIKAIILESER